MSLGFALLLWRFPAVPTGLHRDEMSEAYESYALLKTGADRWGFHLPVYFVSWGSGQNVLQAYLNIPIVAVLGLNRWSVRLLPLICNLLCLPLLFSVSRQWAGTKAALLALLLLACSPWHIMMSRWAVENSILPFFMIFGLWTFGGAMRSPKPWRITVCLLPFVLAMYAYGLVILAAPLLIGILLWAAISRDRTYWPWWSSAALLVVLCSTPLAFFTYKNYITKKNYSFERNLPVSVPLLPETRLAQTKADLRDESPLKSNVRYFTHLMSDNSLHLRGENPPLYKLPDVRAINPLVVVFALFGLILSLIRTFQARKLYEPFAPCVLAFTLVACTVPLNTARCGYLYIPMFELAALCWAATIDYVLRRWLKIVIVSIGAMLVVWPLARFAHEYYFPAYGFESRYAFNPGMPAALAAAQSLAGSRSQIYVSNSIPIDYVNVLYYEHLAPKVFQTSGATWDRPDFGQYSFLSTDIPALMHPFAYVLLTNDADLCSNPTEQQTFDQLKTGLCR